MPLYEFINTKTDEVFEEAMSISDMEKYVKDNPHIKDTFHQHQQYRIVVKQVKVF